MDDRCGRGFEASSLALRCVEAAGPEPVPGAPVSTRHGRGASVRAGVALLLLGVLALSPGMARADGSPTWMVLEADAGVAFPTGIADDALGSALRVTFGAGGRPSGMPIRIHALLSVGHSHFESLVRQSVLRAELSRDLVDVSAGARLTVPLGAHVHVFTEVLGGWGWVGSQVTANAYEELGSDAAGFGLVVGGGVQVRLMKLLALGLRAEWSGVFVPGGVDVASEVAGLQSPGDGTPWGRASVLATTTFHF